MAGALSQAEEIIYIRFNNVRCDLSKRISTFGLMFRMYLLVGSHLDSITRLQELKQCVSFQIQCQTLCLAAKSKSTSSFGKTRLFHWPKQSHQECLLLRIPVMEGFMLEMLELHTCSTTCQCMKILQTWNQLCFSRLCCILGYRWSTQRNLVPGMQPHLSLVVLV